MFFGVSLNLGMLCLVAAELSVGVAPFDVLGLPDEQSEELRRLTVETLLSERRGLQLVPPEAVDAAIMALELGPDELRQCLQEGPCASRLAREAGADALVVGSAAGLGRSFVLRLSLVDASRSVIDQELQHTVEGDLSDLSTALADQLDQLLPPRRPWYRTWWFWTAIGVALATGAVVAAVLLTRDPDPHRDTYPLP